MSNMNTKTLLISIKPKYATKIFDGSKRVELRKTKPRLSGGDQVMIYVSSPTKELRGSFRVQRIIIKPIEELWEFVCNDAGVTKAEFYNYYGNSKKGYGIFFESVEQIKQPVKLEKLRTIWSNFHPPQTYRYLSASETNLIDC